jgi:hypothetical protein
MGIQPGARFPALSADALSASLYEHFTSAIYRNRLIARHVIDVHYEPSCREVNGILRRSGQYLSGPSADIAATLSTRMFEPSFEPSFVEVRLLRLTVSYDVGATYVGLYHEVPVAERRQRVRCHLTDCVQFMGAAIASPAGAVHARGQVGGLDGRRDVAAQVEIESKI